MHVLLVCLSNLSARKFCQWPLDCVCVYVYYLWGKLWLQTLFSLFTQKDDVRRCLVSFLGSSLSPGEPYVILYTAYKCSKLITQTSKLFSNIILNIFNRNLHTWKDISLYTSIYCFILCLLLLRQYNAVIYCTTLIVISFLFLF